MKQTNYQKWLKYRVLSTKYQLLFIDDCKRELDNYLSDERKKKILMKLVLTEPEKEEVKKMGQQKEKVIEEMQTENGSFPCPSCGKPLALHTKKEANDCSVQEAEN